MVKARGRASSTGNNKAASGGSKRAKPPGAQPRKTPQQQKIEALGAQLEPAGYVIVESDGKFGVKKAKGRKLIADQLTVAGLESWVNAALGTSEDQTPQETNEAIATEMNANLNQQAEEKVTTIPIEGDIADQVLGTGEASKTEATEVDADEKEDDSVVAAIAWDMGKGKSPIGGKTANSGHVFYKGKNLYVVEARYEPDNWAVYVERANVASSVHGLEAAQFAALDVADKLAEAEAQGDTGKALESLRPEDSDNEKGKGKKDNSEAFRNYNSRPSSDGGETPLPSDNPNTDPRVAATLKRLFDVSREADLIGNAATPTGEMNQILTELEPLQRSGDLKLSDLLAAVNSPLHTKRAEIALYMARNGVEIRFLSGELIELRTVAVESLAAVSSEDDAVDLDRFL